MKIALLNTTIATLPGTYVLQRATVEEATDLLEAEPDGFVSAIGHDSTATALGLLLGIDVPVNRIFFEQAEGQVAICLRVRGRLPEGQILTLERLEEVGYDLYRLERLKIVREVIEERMKGAGDWVELHDKPYAGPTATYFNPEHLASNLSRQVKILIGDLRELLGRVAS
jgi:hypothetical protein